MAQTPTTPSNTFESYDADTIKILVTTDNHVGFMEKNPIREKDGLDALEEAFQQAHIHNVDMILLGGDLFHENTPSRRSIYGVMKILRKYCLGDRPVSLELMSDPTESIDNPFASLNYQDGNFNIAYPVFSIHGNHDDVAGLGNLSAISILEIAGLVNYFGRVYDPENIEVKPLLFRKGNTHLALYGLSNVRDQRLYRSFVQNQVNIFQPADGSDNWFNLFTIHQNRTAHSPKDYIPESFLSDFIDLVIWGHEHECILEPLKNLEQGFDVIQPGSSIATSCIAAEAKPKHCLILSIKGKSYKHEWIRLKSVRPFVLDDIVLSKITGLEPEDKEEITEVLMEKVNEMILRAKDEWEELHSDDRSKKPSPLPLIRLRVDVEGGFQVENLQRFGQRFVDRVANPGEMLQVVKKRATGTRNRKTAARDETEDGGANVHRMEKMHVKTLIEGFLSKQSLHVLDETRMSLALSRYVEKDDRDALGVYYESSMDLLRKHLAETQGEDDNAIDEEIDQYRTVGDDHEGAGELATSTPALVRSSITQPSRHTSRRDSDDESMLYDSDDVAAVTKPARAITKTRKKVRSVRVNDDDEDESIVEEQPSQRSTRGKTRGTSTRGRGRGVEPKKTNTSVRKTATSTRSKQTALSFEAPMRSQAKRSAALKPPIIDNDDDIVDF